MSTVHPPHTSKSQQNRRHQRQRERHLEIDDTVAEVECRRFDAVERAVAPADDIVFDEIPQGGRPAAVRDSVGDEEGDTCRDQGANQGRDPGGQVAGEEHKDCQGYEGRPGHTPAPHDAWRAARYFGVGG